MTSKATEWRPYATWLLLFGLVGWQLYVGGFDLRPDAQSLLRFGARKATLGFPQEPWRMLASVFLHLNAWHLISNTVVLAAWGACLERLLGRAELCAIFLLTGFAGSLLSDLYGPSSLALGASGAAFGFAGAVLALSFLAPDRAAWRGDAARWRQLSVAVFALGLMTVAGLSHGAPGARLDHWAHGGGALCGLLLGLGPSLAGEKRQRAAFWASALVTAIAMAVVVSTRGANPFS